MVSCSEILARHSEYLDGELTAAEQERWGAHLTECALCARYDRALRKGVELLHQEPRLEPDPEFILHMRYRIAEEERRAALRPISAGATVAVTVAAVLALAAWLPVLVLKGAENPARATASESGVAATEIAWHGGSAVQKRESHVQLAARSVMLVSTHSDLSVIERGYTPLIIESPTAPPSYARVSLTALELR